MVAVPELVFDDREGMFDTYTDHGDDLVVVGVDDWPGLRPTRGHGSSTRAAPLPKSGASACLTRPRKREIEWIYVFVS